MIDNLILMAKEMGEILLVSPTVVVFRHQGLPHSFRVRDSKVILEVHDGPEAGKTTEICGAEEINTDR